MDYTRNCVKSPSIIRMYTRTSHMTATDETRYISLFFLIHINSRITSLASVLYNTYTTNSTLFSLYTNKYKFLFPPKRFQCWTWQLDFHLNDFFFFYSWDADRNVNTSGQIRYHIYFFFHITYYMRNKSIWDFFPHDISNENIVIA